MSRKLVDYAGLGKFKDRLDQAYVAQEPGKGLSTEDFTSVYKIKLDNAVDPAILGTAATKDVGIGAGNIPILDGNGKLDSSVISPESIQEKYAAADLADMVAGIFTTTPSNGSDPDVSDMCVMPTGDVYLLINAPYTVLSNWVQITTPSGAIMSVNAHAGPTVVLTTSDIAEGSSKYYTDARVEAVIAATDSSALADGATILHVSDIETITDAEIDALFAP